MSVSRDGDGGIKIYMYNQKELEAYLCAMGCESRRAIILSGPSGAGKTTIARHLLNGNTCLGFSVSACTRTKRPYEIHSKDYYFLSVREFKHKIAKDEFIEWEEVYTKSYYGTLKTEVARIWAAGQVVIFDMTVQGGLRLKSYFRENALAIYIKGPSLQVLQDRLRQRNTEEEAGVALRMKKVTPDMSLATQFDTILCNEHLPTCLAQVKELLDKFLVK